MRKEDSETVAAIFFRRNQIERLDNVQDDSVLPYTELQVQ